MNKIKIGIVLMGLLGAVDLSGLSAQKVWSLKACLDTAIKRNIALNQGAISASINQVNLNQSKAAVLPNLNLSDAHNIYSGYSLNPYTYQYTTNSFSSNSPSLNSSVTLYNGFLLLNTIKQNKLVYDASLLDVEKAKNDLTLNVLGAYMQVLMDYEAINVASAQVSADSLLVAETEKFVRFGKVAELSLLQTQSQLAGDILNKINADNQLELDKVALLQLMEIPVRPDFDIVKEELSVLFPEITIDPEKIDSISENFLPQIKSFALKTRAARCSLDIAKSGWLPKLVLNGSVKTGYSSIKENYSENLSYATSTIGYLNNNPLDPVIGMIPETNVVGTKDPLSDQLKNNFSELLNFTLTIPIFNNLQVKSAVQIARLTIQNAELNELQTKNDLRKSIETAYTNQVASGKKLIATNEQMRLEKRTYEDMSKKYAVGSSTATDFLIETNNFNRVSISVIQAKYDYVLKTKIVDFYLGKPLIFNK